MNISVQGTSRRALPTSTLVCGTCGVLAAASRSAQVLVIAGSPGDFTIPRLTATTMTLYNVALPPTLTGLNAPAGLPYV